MRDMLFRGQRIDNKEWIYGDLRHWRSGKVGIHNDDMHHTFIVDPSSVGEFTGLPDKNRRRIFEGDICRFCERSNGDMCWIGEVCYEHQQFIIRGGKNKECDSPFALAMSRFIPENIEVIGNIKDNPELLELNE